jgi:hypothetical protein
MMKRGERGEEYDVLLYLFGILGKERIDELWTEEELRFRRRILRPDGIWETAPLPWPGTTPKFSGWAAVSVPPESAPCIGGQLCEGKPGILTYETPDRTYFVVPTEDVVGEPWLGKHPEVVVWCFESQDEATEWTEWRGKAAID